MEQVDLFRRTTAYAETREEPISSIQMERAVVRRRGRARPAFAPEPATYDVRYGDGRVVEAVPLERVRRPRTKVIAPDGKAVLVAAESPQDLIIQASCVGDVATVEMCLDAGARIDTR